MHRVGIIYWITTFFTKEIIIKKLKIKEQLVENDKSCKSIFNNARLNTKKKVWNEYHHQIT
jgi:hypothetical protein